MSSGGAQWIHEVEKQFVMCAKRWTLIPVRFQVLIYRLIVRFVITSKLV